MTDPVTPNRVEQAANAVAALVADLRPEWVTVREAPALLQAFDRLARLAGAAKVLLAARVDESSAPKDAGVRNGGEWIAARTGCSARAGHDLVAASKRLAGLPRLQEALQRGSVSVDQAEEIASAAAADPLSERRLIALAAKVSLKELRTECQRVRAAADPDPERTYERLHGGRRLRSFMDDEGFWRMAARGTPDAGAEMKVLLDAVADEIFREAHADGRRESREAYQFDALQEVFRRAWTQMHEPEQPAPATPASTHAPRKRRRKGGVASRYLGLIRVDHRALMRGWAEGDEVCEIAGAGPIPVPVAQRLLGDAVLKLLITKGQDVTTVLPFRRGPTEAQKAALLWGCPECTRLGCPRPVAEWDHRDPYAHNPQTTVGGLDGVCEHDHDLKTYEGWAFVPGAGKREMVPPTDPRHPGNPTFHRRRKAA